MKMKEFYHHQLIRLIEWYKALNWTRSMRTMNIQQYYRSAANVSLNGSLAAFVPAVAILLGSMFFSSRVPIIVIVLPFCLYSFICYQHFLIQKRRMREAEIAARQTVIPLQTAENVLLTFLPAPSLRMMLFDVNGNLIGEVKDAKFSWWRWFLPYFADRFFTRVYRLSNHEQQLLATFAVNKRTKSVTVYDSDKSELGMIQLHSDASRSFKFSGLIESCCNHQKLEITGSALYCHIHFYDEQGRTISKLLTGWMPQDWSKYFRDANTPILYFDQNMTDKDKYLLIAALIPLYQYRSH
jgi:hypothetical protein